MVISTARNIRCCPGGSTLDDFTDVREIARKLTESGIEDHEDSAGESASGPAYLTLVDPDRNAILIDPHVQDPPGASPY